MSANDGASTPHPTALLLMAALSLVCLAPGATSCAIPLVGYRVGTPRVMAAPGHCASAALVGLLEIYGLPYESEIIDQSLYIPALGGTLGALISAVAEEHGLKLERASGSWQEVETLVKTARPPLLLLGPSPEAANGHVVLITGTGTGGRSVQVTDSDGTISWRRSNALTDAWQQTGCSMLVPVDHIPER